MNFNVGNLETVRSMWHCSRVNNEVSAHLYKPITHKIQDDANFAVIGENIFIFEKLLFCLCSCF